MPFSRLQFQQRIQQNLNDDLGVWFDNASVQDSIQDGYDEILADTQCLESVVQGLTFNPGAIYYDLYNLLVQPNFMRPVRFFNATTNRWIEVHSTQYLDRIRIDWEVAKGTSWWCVIHNGEYISFFPHAPDGTWDLFYKVCPDVLNGDSQLIQLPESHLKVLENYCTADLLESMGEPKKAQDFWSDYSKGIAQLKLVVNSRMSPDLLYQL